MKGRAAGARDAFERAQTAGASTPVLAEIKKAL
jgi:hypothetical protein